LACVAGQAGVYFFGAMSRTRVVDFIDYQNFYFSVRELIGGPGTALGRGQESGTYVRSG